MLTQKRVTQDLLRGVLSILLLFSLFITGCQQKNGKESKPLNTVTATIKSVPTTLYYGGTVSPIQFFNITSPADGVVKSINFKYGERIKKGDVLLVIASSKLQQDFHSALTDYIKAKTTYTNAQINFHGTQQLLKAQIISQQEYLSDQDQYQDAALSYITAKNALERIVSKLPNINTEQLEKLSEGDFAKLQTFLATQTSDLTITAPEEGVVLAPKASDDTSSGGDSSASSKILQPGSQVKEDQTLLTIGDLSGIETTVLAGETVINNIKPGQAVTVTLDALPNVVLQGKVKSVGAQAQTGGNVDQSGVANFPVIVDVVKIPPAQAQLIRVGMSTKVAITLPNPPQIMIPIAAVDQTGSQPTVTVMGPNGKMRVVPITPGRTSADEIAVLNGLKPGDKVVVP